MENIIAWEAGGVPAQALWQSEAGLPVPARVDCIDERISADAAWAQLAEGKALLWQGDWVNARNLLQALIRRAERRFDPRRGKTPATPAEAFARHREVLGQRAILLAGLLVPVTELTPPRDGEQVQTRTVRFRTVGDITCTCPVDSPAASAAEVVIETLAADVSERGATRMDDKTSDASMEKRKKDGYF